MHELIQGLLLHETAKSFFEEAADDEVATFFESFLECVGSNVVCRGGTQAGRHSVTRLKRSCCQCYENHKPCELTV